MVCYAYPRSEQPTKDSAALDNLIPDWGVTAGTHLIRHGNHELKYSIVVFFWGTKTAKKRQEKRQLLSESWTMPPPWEPDMAPRRTWYAEEPTPKTNPVGKSALVMSAAEAPAAAPTPTPTPSAARRRKTAQPNAFPIMSSAPAGPSGSPIGLFAGRPRSRGVWFYIFERGPGPAVRGGKLGNSAPCPRGADVVADVARRGLYCPPHRGSLAALHVATSYIALPSVLWCASAALALALLDRRRG